MNIDPYATDCDKISYYIAKPLRHNTHFDLDRIRGWANLYKLYIWIGSPFDWKYFVEIIQFLVHPKSEFVKIRYQLEDIGDPIEWRIRAIQGHTIKTIVIDNYKIVTDRNQLLVHDTKNINLPSIKENGLLKLRQHIHFNSINSKTLITHVKDRKTDTFLYTTVGKLLDYGAKVYKASNNVYLVDVEYIPFDLLWQLGTMPWNL
jgi:RNA:NAD 2'-phosphotransferase (TPT1/KptA family)